MNVYTIGDGNQAQYSGRVVVNEGNPVAYVPSSSDDSTRDDSEADDTSIVPAAPRRQADRLNVKPEYQYKESESKRTSPSKKRLMTSNDSISIHKVVHGNQIRGNHVVLNERASKNKIGGGQYGEGSFVPWEKQAQWKRHDKWTTASLNHLGEL